MGCCELRMICGYRQSRGRLSGYPSGKKEATRQYLGESRIYREGSKYGLAVCDIDVMQGRWFYRRWGNISGRLGRRRETSLRKEYARNQPPPWAESGPAGVRAQRKRTIGFDVSE